MSSTFINSKTLQELNVSDITKDGSGVLTQDENNLIKYSYVPIENTIYDYKPELGYVAQESPQVYSKDFENKDFRPNISSGKIIKNAVVYEFGIDSLKAGYSTSYETCGFISKKINLGNCSYIQLESNVTEGDSSLEYYIVEGANETPILLANETEIKNEKLFYNLSTRFTINTSKDIVIKKNNTQTNLTLDNIKPNIIANPDSVYTADYFPKYESNKYFPSDNTIQVKVIHREYPFSSQPKIIKSITIKKFGGDAPWNTRG